MNIQTPVSTIYGGFIEQFGDLWQTQIAALQAQFGGAIQTVQMPTDHPTDVPIIYVAKESIIDVLQFMKADAGFQYGFLADITATDESEEGYDWRFEMVYNLYAPNFKHSRIRLKVRLKETEEIATATVVWPGANWAEREVWDMFGIRFTNHPNMRRILMDERWEGHPLRKDYPLRGYQIFPTPAEIDHSQLE